MATLLAVGLLAACGDSGANKVATEPLAGRTKISEVRLVRFQRSLDRIDYDLNTARSGTKPVPPVFVVRLPKNLDTITNPAARKRLFIKVMLPIILRVNEHIRSHRVIFDSLRQKVTANRKLSAVEQEQAAQLAEIYETEPNDWATLDRRIGVIPPSLALAQAAVESGWGTSRFAIEGNALYGERIFSRDGGIVPDGVGDDANFRVRTFRNLMQSVWAYAHNLNTHQSYTPLRAERQAQRRTGALDGAALSHHLTAYSEKGSTYGPLIRDVIGDADLAPFDRAKLGKCAARRSRTQAN